MTAQDHYKTAQKAINLGTWVFYLVLVFSFVLLLFPSATAEAWLHPCLIALATIAIASTVFATIYQTEGNRLLRASQLSDAFGVGIGDQIRDGYYNNALPKTAIRLAATTLENTLFSKEILKQMLIRERTKNSIYLVLLVFLFGCRWTSTSWLLALAQAVFSADLVMSWIRLERFQFRASRVHSQLEQFFLQNGNAKKSAGIAILLAAFADYECAKDEAAIPLDENLFKKLNPKLSIRWEEMKQRLNIC